LEQGDGILPLKRQGAGPRGEAPQQHLDDGLRKVALNIHHVDDKQKTSKNISRLDRPASQTE